MCGKAAVTSANVALSSNGAVASATSRNHDNSGGCDGSAYFANDGQAVQTYSPPGCGDGRHMAWSKTYG